MAKKYGTSLFIFRRDLRLPDNTGLSAALTQSETVIPCFIFTPEQIGPANEYRSLHAIQFMLESLGELNEDLNKKGSRLYLFYGSPATIVAKLLSAHAQAVFVNKDYTPYSKQRDQEIEEICRNRDVDFLSFDDALLHAPGEILNGQGKPYEIFTPFYKKSMAFPIPEPMTLPRGSFFSKPIPLEITHAQLKDMVPEATLTIYAPGGRKSARAILAHSQNFKDYAHTRDFPEYDTTLLSAHNKFGTVSIREVYQGLAQALGEHHPLIRQLYWRDFFYHIAWHYPQVFGHAFHKKFDQLPWSTSTSDFIRWCEGTTGFPLVDAGMRQLNQTGFMHNRARLIVGSFLVKDLHINWQWGEKYFAQQLTDYDPAVNNGNWQWVASTGCDHQPYFRIFNPWLQQKKFDPTATYIKRWIPELKHVDPKIIHSWYKQTEPIKGYPIPMLDHSKEAGHAKALYAQFIAKKA